MPLYHFSLGSDAVSTTDVAIVELPSPQAVVDEAGRILADMARDELRGRDRASVFLIVKDAEGHPVFVSSFSFASVWPDPPPNRLHEKPASQRRRARPQPVSAGD